MQNPTSTLLQKISSLSSYPLSSYSQKLKVDLTFPSDEDRTKQSFKQESDINHIMARYLRTGVLDFAQKYEPRYGDATGLEFEAGMQTIAAAKSMFADLPSALRTRFKNDPAEFLDFVNDDKNLAEAREMGLLRPEAAPVAVAVPVAPAVPAAPPQAAVTL